MSDLEGVRPKYRNMDGEYVRIEPGHTDPTDFIRVIYPDEQIAPPMVEELAMRLFAYSQWRNFDYKFSNIEWMEADREYCRAMAREAFRFLGRAEE